MLGVIALQLMKCWILGIGTGFPCYDDYIKYRYIQYDISMELAECASKYDDYNLRGFILLDDLINFDYNAEVLFDGATEEQIDGLIVHMVYMPSGLILYQAIF